MVKYRGTVIFDAENASIVLGAVEELTGLKRLDQPVKNTFQKKHKRKTIEVHVNERLKKGDNEPLVMRKGKWWRSTAEEHIKNVLADGKVHHSTEIAAACVENGYAKNSTSPRLSELVSRGIVKMLGNGNYKIAENAPEG